MTNIEMIPILIGAACACGLLGAMIGNSKERAGLGFALGFLIGPIGLIVIAILPPKGQAPASIQSRPQRKCPFCAEMILEEAVVCRYCGRDSEQPAPERPLFSSSLGQ